MGGNQSYENQSSPYDYNDDSNDGENVQEAPTEMTRKEHVPPTPPPPPLTPEEQLREVRTQVDSFVGMFNQLLADISVQQRQRTIEEENRNETAEILDQRKVQFEFRRIDELLTQSLLRLDAVDCTSDPQLRQQRKEIINHIEQVLARVDEAKRTVVVV